MPMTEHEINNFGASSDTSSFSVIQSGTAQSQVGQNQDHVLANPSGDNGMFGETSSRGDRRKLFPSSPPVTPRNRFGNLNQQSIANVRNWTARKENLELGSVSKKQLDELQKAIFSPMKSIRNSGSSLSSGPDITRPVQPDQVLYLWKDEAVDMEVLRIKRNFTTGGPPMLPDKPTLEEFHDWQNSIKYFLEFVPGYQDGMLELPPNLEDISPDDLFSISERYKLISQILTRATVNNKLVKLKTSSINQYPVFDICTWWATVAELFQPSEVQIQVLCENYTACVQQDHQSGTEFLQVIEEKAAELKQLGVIYDNTEIGKKVYDGLNYHLKEFVYTNLMSQRLICDLASVIKKKVEIK